MKIIPVLDLLGGQVVRAERGMRNQYRPLVSSLCSSSDPCDVMDALLELYPFETLYIADLDAIQDHGKGQMLLVSRLKERHPETEIWLDRGATTPLELLESSQAGLRNIIASECLRDGAHLVRLVAADADALLSLDFSAHGLMAPVELMREISAWPNELLCMTLAKVGSREGPDWDRITRTLTCCGDRKLYAAGGVRGRNDLDRLTSLGIYGVLVASALHDGDLRAADIASVMEANAATSPGTDVRKSCIS